MQVSIKNWPDSCITINKIKELIVTTDFAGKDKRKFCQERVNILSSQAGG